jgi:hypothetical protein
MEDIAPAAGKQRVRVVKGWRGRSRQGSPGEVETGSPPLRGLPRKRGAPPPPLCEGCGTAPLSAGPRVTAANPSPKLLSCNQLEPVAQSVEQRTFNLSTPLRQTSHPYVSLGIRRGFSLQAVGPNRWLSGQRGGFMAGWWRGRMTNLSPINRRMRRGPQRS